MRHTATSLCATAVKRAGRLQRIDVVDHRCARRDRFAHQLGLSRIDGYRHGAAGKLLEHRQHASALLLERDAARARTRRFAADVDEVGAFVHQPARVGERRARGGETAAVGKRIGSDIDDPHDKGARERQPEFTALKIHRGV